MSGEVPVSIKHNVAALLSSRVKGIPMSEFLSDYRNVYFESLKIRDHGFSSLQDFIKSIPDVARMMTTQDSDVKIFGVGEPNSHMPLSPKDVHGCFPQNPIKTSTKEKLTDRNGVSTHTSTSDDYWKPDFSGLWTVCSPVNVCPTKKPQDLIAIFSQAGKVKETMLTERLVFVRYASKKEALLATEIFRDLHVKIANSHKGNARESKKQTEDINGINSGQMRERSRVKDFETQRNSRDTNKKLHSNINHSVNDRNTGAKKGSSILEQLYGTFHIDEKPNGNHLGEEDRSELLSNCHQSKLASTESRPHSVASETDFAGSGKTALFVANIECENDFREMIKRYDPVSVRVKKGGRASYAFVKVTSEEKAKQVIRDLHNFQQKTKKILVDFDRNESNPNSGDSNSVHSHVAESKITETNEVPLLLTDFSDMPPLIHESDLGPHGADYHLDCSIFVAHFPRNTLVSELRNAFEKYNVLDICMINNGSGLGCTKATLYLRSVYDVIDAVVEMDGSNLKVDVPFDNIILKSIVKNEMYKRSALSPSYSSYDNINSQSPPY